MPRAKTTVASRKRRKKILKAAKGYWGGKKNLLKTAKEAVEKGMQYSYRDRRVKKREFRKLWIIRINAAVRPYGLSYSRFIHLLDKKEIGINRKVLADLAVSDPIAFQKIVESVQKA
ncbi:50S ribosomal protein L20 [bacterium]|nr:50S ribosomal protein L20 [bacterium]